MTTITERLPPNIPDSLLTYSIIADPSDLHRFLTPVLENYISAATSAPPEYTPALTASRPEGCEICGREQLQLTYHHLIPRQVWAKAVKRDWCKEWQLQKVCWLVSFCVPSCFHSHVRILDFGANANTMLVLSLSASIELCRGCR